MATSTMPSASATGSAVSLAHPNNNHHVVSARCNCGVPTFHSRGTHVVAGNAPLNTRHGWLHVSQIERFDQELPTLLRSMGFDGWLAEEALGELSARLTSPSDAGGMIKLGRGEQELRVGNLSRQEVAASVRRAFAYDSLTQRALCYLLAPDYACINALLPLERQYAIPPACQHVHATIMQSSTHA